MKLIITVTTLLVSTILYSQSSLTGKWKPVFFYLDTMARGDVKADTLYINPEAKKNFKDDDDPKASEEMVRFVLVTMLKKMKETQEEYFEDGKYEETNTRTGRKKTGKYVFDKTKNTLEKTQPPLDVKQSFTISWKNGQLVLTNEMESSNGKKGKLKVIYEKL